MFQNDVEIPKFLQDLLSGLPKAVQEFITIQSSIIKQQQDNNKRLLRSNKRLLRSNR